MATTNFIFINQVTDIETTAGGFSLNVRCVGADIGGYNFKIEVLATELLTQNIEKIISGKISAEVSKSLGYTVKTGGIYGFKIIQY